MSQYEAVIAEGPFKGTVEAEKKQRSFRARNIAVQAFVPFPVPLEELRLVQEGGELFQAYPVAFEQVGMELYGLR